MVASSRSPSESRWAAAWRIEADPTARIKGLRAFRAVTAIGSVVAGVLLIVLLLGPFAVLSAVPSFVVYLFVGYLFALAPATWFALSWAIRRVADRIAFDDDGLLVHTVGGKFFDIPWASPDLAMDLTNWGASDFTRGTILLTSRMKNGLPEGVLTVEGVGALKSEALGRGLSVEEKVEGKSPKTFGVIELRPHSTLPASATPAAVAAPEADPAQ